MNPQLSIHPSPYGLLMLAGIGVSILLWRRMARRDERLLLIYIGGLCGAFLGAKIVYILAEGWLHFGADDVWLQLATGKTIVGALLGGYAGVELCKKLTNHTSSTGDWFAIIAPVGIIFGRFGCLLHGCCLGNVCEPAWYSMKDAAGVDRWPAVPIEIVFNILFLVVLFGVLRPQKCFFGQHFHLYLIAYGLFRFAHEAVRATPKILGPFSGYQIGCLALIGLGAARFWQRSQPDDHPGIQAPANP